MPKSASIKGLLLREKLAGLACPCSKPNSKIVVLKSIKIPIFSFKLYLK